MTIEMMHAGLNHSTGTLSMHAGSSRAQTIYRHDAKSLPLQDMLFALPESSAVHQPVGQAVQLSVPSVLNVPASRHHQHSAADYCGNLLALSLTS